MFPLKHALDLINAAIRSAQGRGLTVSVVVVDRGGRTIASARDDSASYFSVGAAERKAVTAVNFGVATHQLMQIVKDDALLLAAVSADNSLSALPGGMPIKVNGSIVAAVGVAGAHYSQDQSIAEEAMTLLGGS